VIPHTQSRPIEARRGWRHAFFPDSVRFVLAPLILFFSGFFTTKFTLSGTYTWPRTSQTFALMLIVLILSREFVYKEQLSRHATPGRAWAALAYSCVLPYIIGVVVMLTLWAR
jgi:membrane protein CcdC involved in cytochrome C biogenesis